jgi:CRP/FNR family transcriptional regulator, cyclic AMP receptor protein
VLRKDVKVAMIARVPLFAGCSKNELRQIAALADEVDLAAGTKLTKEGSSGKEFVVIVEGGADVHRRGRKLRSLGAGDFLGEIALISGAPRTATVTTTADSRLLVLTDRSFRRVIEKMPSVQGSIMKALSERLWADTL